MKNALIYQLLATINTDGAHVIASRQSSQKSNGASLWLPRSSRLLQTSRRQRDTSKLKDIDMRPKQSIFSKKIT
ncbi:hypothetical protein [Lacticaseibacillus paracasei]|uniref:hypothetical protein n=1 Tax=Lacticaseibacillus paracasei TaxID=1597 RepID=UPI0031F711AA